MDRIDIHVDVPAVPYKDLTNVQDAESSEAIRHRVHGARSIQAKRYRGGRIYCNAQMRNRHIKKYCAIGQNAHRILEMAIDKLGLSARAFNRVLKIARTIADLDGVPNVSVRHVSEGIQYRSLDRNDLLP